LFDLTGKVAVVSGGSRGIGLMMARGLLEAGASVYISSRKPEAGQAAMAELSKYGVVLSMPADLAREEECVRLAAEVGRFTANGEGIALVCLSGGMCGRGEARARVGGIAVWSSRAGLVMVRGGRSPHPGRL
jgi:NAD(P)-dependent dehydrogenase (short-subunit alcohol dehydrogenase family)